MIYYFVKFCKTNLFILIYTEFQPKTVTIFHKGTFRKLLLQYVEDKKKQQVAPEKSAVPNVQVKKEVREKKRDKRKGQKEKK